MTVVLHWEDGKLLPTLWEASGKPLAPIRLCDKTGENGAQNAEEEKMANFSLEENIRSLVPSVPAMSPTVWRGLGSGPSGSTGVGWVPKEQAMSRRLWSQD